MFALSRLLYLLARREQYFVAAYVQGVLQPVQGQSSATGVFFTVLLRMMLMPLCHVIRLQRGLAEAPDMAQIQA